MSSDFWLGMVGLIAVFGLHYAMESRAKLKEVQRATENIWQRLNRLEEGMERAGVNSHPKRPYTALDHFRDLPPLLVEDFIDIRPGGTVSLLLLEYLPSGGGVMFPVEFIRGELEYRTPGTKDAVLHGKARLSDSNDDFQAARILFSQYHKTAELKGLVLEGGVKLA